MFKFNIGDVVKTRYATGRITTQTLHADNQRSYEVDTSDFNWYEHELTLIEDDIEPNPCQFGIHQLVDDTALRTWCKDCNVDVEWSRDTMSFEITINNTREII